MRHEEMNGVLNAHFVPVAAWFNIAPAPPDWQVLRRPQFGAGASR